MTIFAASIYKDQQSEMLANKLINHVRLSIDKPHIIHDSFVKIIYGSRKDNANHNKIVKFGSKESNLYGFLIGRLFEKTISGSKLVNKIEQVTIKEIFASEGKYLSQHYWGQYLLIIQDNLKQKLMIFPDPLGFSSLFYAEINGNLLISSDVWCIKDILGKHAPLEDSYLTSLICNPIGDLITTTQTAFKGINEVTQGLALIVEYRDSKLDTRVIEFWDQFDIKSKYNIKQSDILPVFFDVIKAHQQESPNICVHLSGGLDSSSLLMAANFFANNEIQLTALTYGNKLIDSSNEIDSAKQIADFCNLNLTIYPWTRLWDFNSDINPHERLDRPSGYIYNTAFHRDIEDITLKHGNVVFWDGHGGDQIFHEGDIKEAMADYFIDHKFAGFKDYLMKSCKLSRKSIPYFLKNTFSALARYYLGLLPNNQYFKLEKPKWLLYDLDHSQYRKIIVPDIFRKCKNIQPGKASHIISIYEGIFQSKVSNKLDKVATIYPYYAQPLVEMALSIPLYDLYDENYSRILFRKAIGNFFKTDLIYRRSKGETSGILQLSLKQNINSVKELCLDGYFAKNGFIDKKELEISIARLSHGIMDHSTQIFTLLSVEAWLKSWSLVKQ